MKKRKTSFIDRDGDKQSFSNALTGTSYEGEPIAEQPGLLRAEGKIERVICQKENWAAILVRSPIGTKYQAAGSIIMAQPGAFIRMDGEWVETERFGRQFKAKSSEIDITKMDVGSIESLLSSKFVTGVGAERAAAICERFGDTVFHVVEHDYMQLTTVPGIGKKTAERIHDSFLENRQYIQLGAMLKPEVSDGQIKKFVDKYKTNAYEHIKEDPYKLIQEFDGIGFKKADKIAVRSLKMGLNDIRRIDAAITCAIDEASKDGHCFLYIEQIYGYVNKLISGSQGGNFTEEEINARIKAERIAKRLVVERAGGRFMLYTEKTWKAENRVAATLYTLATAKDDPHPVTQTAIDMGIADTEREIGNGFTFEALQREAVKTALTSRVCVITGGPGTGKTTCLKAILAAYTKIYPAENVLLCAPTGRAASRMRDVTQMPASTIHSAINKRPGSSGDNLLVISDEASMDDIYTADILMALLSRGGRLIIIGDPDQLPSVGAGNFLNDIIDSGVVPVVRLEVCYRNSGAIAKNADRINHGLGVEDFDEDEEFQFVSSHGSNLQSDVLEQYYALVDKYGVKDTCCIVPMRQYGRGTTNTELLNLIIRDKLNPDPSGKKIDFQQQTGKPLFKFRVNDRVMLTKNLNNEQGAPRIFVNGDLGMITMVTDKTVEVLFDDGVCFTFEKGVFEKRFVLAYACTVHKCQGQEYSAIVIACANEHYWMLQRNLVYTAITRAKKRCVLVGEAASVRIAAKTERTENRNTLLKPRLLHPEWREIRFNSENEQGGMIA